jgi:hypothetical protein
LTPSNISFFPYYKNTQSTKLKKHWFEDALICIKLIDPERTIFICHSVLVCSVLTACFWPNEIFMFLKYYDKQHLGWLPWLPQPFQAEVQLPPPPLFILNPYRYTSMLRRDPTLGHRFHKFDLYRHGDPLLHCNTFWPLV